MVHKVDIVHKRLFNNAVAKIEASGGRCSRSVMADSTSKKGDGPVGAAALTVRRLLRSIASVPHTSN